MAVCLTATTQYGDVPRQFPMNQLTDEEWLLMRQHPQFAYEMLRPIKYLRQSLDIPYCHHEKWDGAGYPRGLRVRKNIISFTHQ